MVNVCSDLEDCFKKSRAVPGTRSSHHFVLISCNKTAHELTSEDSEFLQFDFDKSLSKEIDINNIKVFSYVSCIYNIFWWVGMTEVNAHEGDLKTEFFTHMDLKKLSAGHLLLMFCPSFKTFYALSQLQQQYVYIKL